MVSYISSTKCKIHTISLGLLDAVCTTHRSRELTKNFPPLAEKVQPDESVQVSGYMDYLKTQLKTKHNKTTTLLILKRATGG